VIADPALIRAASTVVLDPVAPKHHAVPVVHHDRDLHRKLPVGGRQDLSHLPVEIQPVGRFVIEVRRGLERSHVVRRLFDPLGRAYVLGRTDGTFLFVGVTHADEINPEP
jgi:hypothetical protein